MRFFALLALTVVACSGGTASTTSSSDQNLGDSCHYPAGVKVAPGGPSGSECVADPSFKICQVSNGATVNAADGAVSGGTETCQSPCDASQYEMSCSGSSPDPSLGCTVIPIPTPPSSSFYCCPCAAH